MKLAPSGAVEMLRTAIERKTDLMRQHRELTKKAEATLCTLKEATVIRDELLAEKARLDEALKDATAMAEVAQKLCDEDVTSKERKNGIEFRSEL